MGLEKEWFLHGRAIVNMVSHEDAKHLRAHFEGFSNWRVESQSVCRTRWEEPLQGFDALVQRYRNSFLMHARVPDACKPAIFQNGRRAKFLGPTKRIRLPKKQPSSFDNTQQ